MTIVQCLETVTNWLRDNVCSKIKLKAPHDEAVEKYEEVAPTAFTIFQPGKTQAPPENIQTIPSIVVQPVEGGDEPTKPQRRIKLQLSFMVWNPGKHKEEGAAKFTRNTDGWKDVWNFVDRTLQEIENAEYMDGIRVVKELGITFGQFQQDNSLVDLYPYWGAWAILTIENGITRTADPYKNLI